MAACQSDANERLNSDVFRAIVVQIDGQTSGISPQHDGILRLSLATSLMVLVYILHSITLLFRC